MADTTRYIDHDFYKTTFKGDPAVTAEDFPRLEARAADIVDALTAYVVNTRSLDWLKQRDPFAAKQFELAVAAQVEFLELNGIETANDGGQFTERGFTVGKVKIDSYGNGSGQNNQYASADLVQAVSPLAVSLLEPTGLLNRSVGVV